MKGRKVDLVGKKPLTLSRRERERRDPGPRRQTAFPIRASRSAGGDRRREEVDFPRMR